LQRQLEDKDSEIEELNTLVNKLKGKISEQKSLSEQADKAIQEQAENLERKDMEKKSLEKEIHRLSMQVEV